jgi:hypothetical protein
VNKEIIPRGSRRCECCGFDTVQEILVSVSSSTTWAEACPLVICFHETHEGRVSDRVEPVNLCPNCLGSLTTYGYCPHNVEGRDALLRPMGTAAPVAPNTSEA